MFYKFVNLPVFINIGNDILYRFEDILKTNNLYFKNPLILTGNVSGSIMKKYSFYSNFAKHYINIYNENSITDIRRKIIDKGIDLIVGCGGGRVIDLGKYLSSETFTPFVSIPTILSNDGVSSPISVLRIKDSYKATGSTMPLGIVVDINVIKSAPISFLHTGVGDLLSNISAFYDWKISSMLGKDKYDSFAAAIAYIAASNIVNKLNTYGKILDSEDFLIDLAQGLVLSGISIAIAGTSRPASGSEHNISHALDKILGANRKLHGIQVGFATLLTLYLQKQYELMERIKSFYRTIGFPTTFEELGISKGIFTRAVKMAPFIRDRYTILNEVEPKYIVKSIQEVYDK